MDFRCFESLDLEAPEAGAILTGDNAQGKTSILEAICMLVRLQSPRSHRLATLARIGKDGFGIAGNAWSEERQVKWNRKGIDLKQNQSPCASRSEYLSQGGLIVWMGNEDLELVRGPGETRRRYLDFIGSQIDPAYRRSLARYRRALLAKNLLLREGLHRDKEIFSYDQILAEHGSQLIKARAQMIAQLNPYAAELVAGVVTHQERIDELLTTYSLGWTLERMPGVDRAILRLGAYEVLWGDVPEAVALDEAVTLARELSTDDSPAFVNGLLARIVEQRSTLDLEA